MASIKMVLGKNENFVESNVMGAMEEIGLDVEKVPLFYIYTNEGSKDCKISTIQNMLYGLDVENCVLIADAHVSESEFPSERYITEESKNNLIDKVLERESQILESLGFIDINFYVKYEFKKAYIYGNENGKRIVEYFKSLEFGKTPKKFDESPFNESEV